MKTAAIIIGHSKTDSGALSPTSDWTEYKYNSILAELIASELSKVGSVKPLIVHRDTYGHLPAKVNATRADVALELHCNAFNTQVSGTEMLYWHTSSKGKALAEALQKAAYESLALPNRGVKPINSNARGGFLLKKTTMPCVIVESFFIDNDNDIEQGLQWQSVLATAYANAIEDYLE